VCVRVHVCVCVCISLYVYLWVCVSGVVRESCGRVCDMLIYMAICYRRSGIPSMRGLEREESENQSQHRLKNIDVGLFGALF